jgi:serine/threonine-protein kinase
MERDRSPSAAFPARVGRYDLIVPIASGGMATVYLGETLGPAGFRKTVAVKLVHQHLRDDSEFCRALLAEAALTVRIRHPNVVPVLDAGEDSSAVFLVMEYFEAASLDDLLREHA